MSKLKFEKFAQGAQFISNEFMTQTQRPLILESVLLLSVLQHHLKSKRIQITIKRWI